ncbi:transporter substrate-binding domain-containing protein [uncultured Roseibium sp.]|uniref:transporter substrate-binding domain-containing protein n=1 Tax=uncultured Roseibium sp. TaxID=1936171 RepID=UPI002639EA14|nr:transporter substrate-binding domain-containing protein [uncultured Roseibium sp.]
MKKIVTATFGAFLVATLTQSAGAEELDGTLAKIDETALIRVGHRESAIPFSYLDDNQKPIGYSLELCAHIVDTVKRKLGRDDIEFAYVPVTSQTRIPLMVNGVIDLECGSTTNNLERQTQVSYAPTMFVAAGRLLVKKSSGIKEVADLKGKVVAANQGSNPVRVLGEMNQSRNIGLTMGPSKDFAESFLLLETDRVSAVAQDDILLAGLKANARNPEDYEIVGEPYTVEPYGIMLRKGDPQFKELADEAMKAMMADGTFAAIYEKWFQNPIPPRNVNLNLPMSPELQKVVANPTDSGDPANYR